MAQIGADFHGVAAARPAPIVSPDMPRAAATAAPATCFTYIPVRPFRAGRSATLAAHSPCQGHVTSISNDLVSVCCGLAAFTPVAVPLIV